MGRVKAKTQIVQEPYVPKPDTHIYVYIRKSPLFLIPIPYKHKPNYQYILPLIKN